VRRILSNMSLSEVKAVLAELPRQSAPVRLMSKAASARSAPNPKTPTRRAVAKPSTEGGAELERIDREMGVTDPRYGLYERRNLATPTTLTLGALVPISQKTRSAAEHQTHGQRSGMPPGVATDPEIAAVDRAMGFGLQSRTELRQNTLYLGTKPRS
jgi:hypothetical protein